MKVTLNSWRHLDRPVMPLPLALTLGQARLLAGCRLFALFATENQSCFTCSCSLTVVISPDRPRDSKFARLENRILPRSSCASCPNAWPSHRMSMLLLLRHRVAMTATAVTKAQSWFVFAASKPTTVLMMPLCHGLRLDPKIMQTMNAGRCSSR